MWTLLETLPLAPAVHAAVQGVSGLVPHPVAGLSALEHSAYVRFSLLALSSIFFLVDPFAALPTFLAVTAGADAPKRRPIARKASITSFLVLSAFALAGQFYLPHVRDYAAGV